MTTIKFGTDGWRAIIAKEYTTDNVARVATATAKWLVANYETPKAVIGYDCRFGGLMFTEVTVKVLCSHGIKVYMDKNFASTPMVSLAATQLGAGMGVVITASHNPPSYNGYKLKSEFGGPAVPAVIAEVENLIPETADTPNTSLADYEAQGLLEYLNLEDRYIAHIESGFDLATIKNSDLNLGYDAMYGSGQNAMRRLFPNATLLHCDYNPSFMGQAPEPIHKNLLEFSNLIKTKGNIDIGVANDGDADRIGVYDSKGNFVDSHHVILLLVHYLHKYQGLSGKVLFTFSVTDKVKKLCEHYGLDYEITKIGFKYICEMMTAPGADVLVGGEESGGIAVKGHIPERDGIWVGLLLMEFMAKTGKTLEALIQEVYDITGPFAFNRNDMHIENDLKWAIIDNCKANKYSEFGKYKVQSVESVDGYKFYFSDDEWVMIRPSGTEPVLRVYAQAPDMDGVTDILNEVGAALL